MATHDPRTTEYNQEGDVWQHSYAYHNRELPTPQRSPDHLDICDRLWYAAQVNEAGDRKLAQLLRDAQAHISALETLIATMRKPAEVQRRFTEANDSDSQRGQEAEEGFRDDQG